MPLLKEERDMLILCYDMKIISHDEFLLQFDADRPEAPNLPYDSYPEFNLDEMNGDKWLAECQFKKSWYSFATRQLFCRFIDDTVRPISRPERHKRTLHNGHKRAHPLKFQSLVLPCCKHAGVVRHDWNVARNCRMTWNCRWKYRK